MEERDVFEEAAEIIDATLGSLNRVEPFPSDLPAIVLPFLGHFGETLKSGERLFVRARTSVEEVYVDLSARALLSERYSYFVRGSLECARQQGAVAMLKQLAAMGEAAPPGTWDNVPTDLSMR